MGRSDDTRDHKRRDRRWCPARRDGPGSGDLQQHHHSSGGSSSNSNNESNSHGGGHRASRDERRFRLRSRSRSRSKSRSRSRSRDRSTRNRTRSRSRSRETRHTGDSGSTNTSNNRWDQQRRDRNRPEDRGERNRSRERRKSPPELPRKNKLFDRARKLGIVSGVADASTLAGASTALVAPPGERHDQATAILPTAAAAATAQSATSAAVSSAASLAAARALALSAALTGGAGRTTPGTGPVPSAGTENPASVYPPGLNVPAYYNPANINAQRIAEQIKKRKMLWTRPPGSDASKEKDNEKETAQADSPDHNSPGSSTVKYWAKATFKGDDGKTTAKFRKLMGMKDDDVKDAPPPGTSSEVLEEQDKLFRHLDMQYQAARQSTHSQRGMGLGWGH